MNHYSEKDHSGLADAQHVVRSGIRSKVTQGDEKLLGFFLRHGECDASITKKPVIEVVFSWLNRRKPSTYFGSLAPGLLSQLMDLGGIDSISDSADFPIGPGISGTGLYRISFEKKWVRIFISDDGILIRVRDGSATLRIPLRDKKPAREQIDKGRLRAQIAVQRLDKGKLCIFCPAEVSERLYQHFVTKYISTEPPRRAAFGRYPQDELIITSSYDNTQAEITAFVAALPEVCYERD